MFIFLNTVISLPYSSCVVILLMHRTSLLVKTPITYFFYNSNMDYNGTWFLIVDINYNSIDCAVNMIVIENCMQQYKHFVLLNIVAEQSLIHISLLISVLIHVSLLISQELNFLFDTNGRILVHVPPMRN